MLASIKYKNDIDVRKFMLLNFISLIKLFFFNIFFNASNSLLSSNKKLCYKKKEMFTNFNNQFRILQSNTNSSNLNISSTTISIDIFALMYVVAGTVVCIAVVVIVKICCTKKKQIRLVKTHKTMNIEFKKSEIIIKEEDKEKIYFEIENKKNFENILKQTNKPIDETILNANIDKYMDKSTTDRKLLDSTYRKFEGNIIVF